MIQCFVEAYPWDLTAPESDAVLARMHGEIGVTGLCVWAAARPSVTLRARPWEPRIFRSRGGLYFQPSAHGYEKTRCRPPVSSWTHEGERFARVTAACERHGLALRLLISASATGRLAERYPEFAARGVFGLESTRNLCLGNPDVQEYVAALAADLAQQFKPAAVVVEDFSICWQEAFDPGLLGDSLNARRGDGQDLLNRNFAALLGVCFCSSCRKQADDAGIDSTAAAECVEGALHNLLVREIDKNTSVAQLRSTNVPLNEYLRFQSERLNGLMRRLTAVESVEWILARDSSHPGDSISTSTNPAAPAAILSRAGDALSLDAAMVGEARRNELRVTASSALGPGGPEFVSTVQRAVTMGFAGGQVPPEPGFSGVQVDHFGLLTDGGLATLKQAIRFARRSQP